MPGSISRAIYILVLPAGNHRPYFFLFCSILFHTFIKEMKFLGTLLKELLAYALRAKKSPSRSYQNKF